MGHRCHQASQRPRHFSNGALESTINEEIRLVRSHGSNMLSSSLHQNSRYSSVFESNEEDRTYMTTRHILMTGTVLISHFLSAQISGGIDHSFNEGDLGFGNGDGASSYVKKVAIQADGKTIIAGEFVTFNGVDRGRIARLNVDGSLDVDFASGPGADQVVYTLAIQPDGKVVIGGAFTTYHGMNRSTIARLNEDGSLDVTFDPGSGVMWDGASGLVNSIVIQPDGKILIGGAFTNINGVAQSGIARLNSDGSLDPSFNVGLGVDGQVASVAHQPDGRIILVGEFVSYNGVNCNGIVRLEQDGAVDPSFDAGSGPDGTLSSVVLQLDGKIIIGGEFMTFDGTDMTRVARLDPDGTLDPSFDPDNWVNGRVNAMAIQPDGKILVVGETVPGIIRLNPSGVRDESFSATSGPHTTLNGHPAFTVAVQANGAIILGGAFGSFDLRRCGFVVRLSAIGVRDATFNRGTGADRGVSALALQPNGQILIGGWITAFNGVAKRYLARLQNDGTLDNSFNTGAGPDQPILSILPLANGKTLVGGSFAYYNGENRRAIVRLNVNGSLDFGFNAAFAANTSVDEIVPQEDGKLLVAGSFSKRIARLNENGTVDGTFQPGEGFNMGPLYAIALEPNGRILVGGSFSEFDGTARNRIARLNADGSLDYSFDPGLGASDPIECVALQPDGKILIAGSFTTFNGVGRIRIARLLSDGSVDPSFDPGDGANRSVQGLEVQPDGKVVIVGAFTEYDGVERNRIARLNMDGSLDTSFDPGSGANHIIHALVLAPDGKCIIAGAFTGYDGTGRNRVARIQGGVTGVRELSRVSIEVYPNPTTGLVTLPMEKDGTNWVTLRDASGRVVLEERHRVSRGQRLTITVDHLVPGIYVLEMRSGSGNRTTRLIKQ